MSPVLSILPNAHLLLPRILSRCCEIEGRKRTKGMAEARAGPQVLRATSPWGPSLKMKAVVPGEGQPHIVRLLETRVLVNRVNSACEAGHGQKQSKDMTLRDLLGPGEKPEEPVRHKTAFRTILALGLQMWSQ